MGVCDITNVKSSASAKDYYRNDGPSGIPGRTGGKLARLIGLSLQVVQREFEALIDNLNPFTDSKLKDRNRSDGRAFTDFTFSADKRLSILDFYAPELGIFDVHREASYKAMDWAEQFIQARDQAAGRNVKLTVGNWAWLEFPHPHGRPSREDRRPDPQRHNHFAVPNLVWDASREGYYALERGQIVGEQLAQVFRDETQVGLKRIGIVASQAFEQGKFKGFHIDGFPESTVPKFSRRTLEIEKEKERIEAARGQALSSRAKSKLGAMFRLPKSQQAREDDLRSYWMGKLTVEEKSALDRVVTKVRHTVGDRPKVSLYTNAKERGRYGSRWGGLKSWQKYHWLKAKRERSQEHVDRANVETHDRGLVR